MTSRKQKLTDDEIEAEILADLDDPSAWDEPIFSTAVEIPSARMGHARTTSGAFCSFPRSVDIAPAWRGSEPDERISRQRRHHRRSSPGTRSYDRCQDADRDDQMARSTFQRRRHHYVAFVCYARKAMNDPSTAPDVLIFPSALLKAFVDRQTSPTLNVQSLAAELGISDSWQQLLVKAA